MVIHKAKYTPNQCKNADSWWCNWNDSRQLDLSVNKTVCVATKYFCLSYIIRPLLLAVASIFVYEFSKLCRNMFKKTHLSTYIQQHLFRMLVLWCGTRWYKNQGANHHSIYIFLGMSNHVAQWFCLNKNKSSLQQKFAIFPTFCSTSTEKLYTLSAAKILLQVKYVDSTAKPTDMASNVWIHGAQPCRKKPNTWEREKLTTCHRGIATNGCRDQVQNIHHDEP